MSKKGSKAPTLVEELTTRLYTLVNHVPQVRPNKKLIEIEFAFKSGDTILLEVVSKMAKRWPAFTAGYVANCYVNDRNNAEGAPVDWLPQRREDKPAT